MWGINNVHSTTSNAPCGRSRSEISASTNRINRMGKYKGVRQASKIKINSQSLERNVSSLTFFSSAILPINQIAGITVVIIEATRQTILSVWKWKKKFQPIKWVAPNIIPLRYAVAEIGPSTIQSSSSTSAKKGGAHIWPSSAILPPSKIFTILFIMVPNPENLKKNLKLARRQPNYCRALALVTN